MSAHAALQRRPNADGLKSGLPARPAHRPAGLRLAASGGVATDLAAAPPLLASPENRPGYLRTPDETIAIPPALILARHAAAREGDIQGETPGTVPDEAGGAATAAGPEQPSDQGMEPDDVDATDPARASQGDAAAAPQTPSSGSARREGRSAPTEPGAAREQAENETIPEPERGPVSLLSEAMTLVPAGAAFKGPTALGFGAERRADARPEPRTADIQGYAAVFATAAAAARRLYDDLVADAAAAQAASRAAAALRADRRQAALDAGLDELSEGLAAARARLRISTELALLRLEARAADARVTIRVAAQRAYGSLAAAKARIETGVAKQRAARVEITVGAWANVGTVAILSGQAIAALKALQDKPADRFGAARDPMESAVNEAIATRLPDRAGRRIEFYAKEMVAQCGWLTQNYLPLQSRFDQLFAGVDRLIANAGVAGPRAVGAARRAALDRLDRMSARMRQSILAGRARAEAGLVRQHDRQRAQLIAAHRGRAQAEATAAARRADADTQAANGLAGAQGSVVAAVAQGLFRERTRPEGEFARVVISTARGVMRRVAAVQSEQRPRLARTAMDGRLSLDRQSIATTARLDASGTAAVARIDEMAGQTADALAGQSDQVAAGFPALAEPVSRSIQGFMPPVGKAFKKVLDDLATAMDETRASVAGVMTKKPEPGGADTGKGKQQAPTGPPPKILPPADFVAMTNTVAKDATRDANLADLITRAGRAVPTRMRDKASAVYDNLSNLGTNVIPVMRALRAITARQGEAITAVYNGDIVFDIRVKLPKMLSTNKTNRLNVEAALAYLRGNDLEGAARELQAAVNWSNENDRINEIQKSMAPERWAALEKDHAGELAEVRDDLGTQQRQIFDAMASEGSASAEHRGEGFAKANAILLREGLDTDRSARGDKGADAAVDRLAGASKTVADDPIAGGDPLGLQDQEVQENLAKTRWLQTKRAFANLDEVKALGAGDDADAALVRYATRARDYTVFVPDAYSESGGHYEIKTEGVSDELAKLVGAIVKHGPDSDEAAGARLLVEMTRPGGPKPDRFDMALHDPGLDAREGESDVDRAKAMPKREEEARARQERIFAQYERARIGTGPVRPAAVVRNELSARIGVQFLGDPSAAAYMQAMLKEPSAANRTAANNAAIDYAMKHEDGRAATLKRTFGRMTRDEIDASVKAWDDDHGGPGSMYRQLNLFGKGSWWTEKLSGDERNEVELATFGVARDDRERAEIARHTVEQQIRDAGWLGKLLAHGDYERMLESRDQLQKLMGVSAEDFDTLGRLRRDPRTKALLQADNFGKDGKFQPPRGSSPEALEAAMQIASLSAASYRIQTDRIATAVTTALVVIAAVVTTALTGGAAASIWIPVLVTAGAGLVGIGMSAAIKGNRYSRAEMERDLVVTLVQAATAGLGAAAGVALRGGAPALRAVASRAVLSEKVLEKFMQVGGRGVLRQSLTLGEEALIAGGANALNSAAAAAMDPAARVRGRSGEEAWNAGLRGFFGGALGAAVMRPIAAGNKIPGMSRAPPANMGYGQALARRALGTGVSNASTRAFELGWDHASGKRRITSSAEALDDLRATFFQGLIQGAAEHAAGHATDARRAARSAPREEPRIAPAHADTVPAVIPTEAAQAAELGRALRPDTVPDSAADTLPGGHRPDEAAPGQTRPDGTRPDQTRPGMGMADEGDGPVTQRVPAEPQPVVDHANGWIDHPNGVREFKRLPEMTVMMDADPTSLHAANDNYAALILDTPGREVALYHNPETGTYIVVQGIADTVFVGHDQAGERQAPAPAGTAQAWKEILPADAGRWELRAHYHPDYTDPAAHPALKRLPSGATGDFGAMAYESKMAGNTARSSRIHYLENGQFRHTDFGIDPAQPRRPYWVEFDNPRTGQRDRREFRSLAEFDNWTGRLLRASGAEVEPITVRMPAVPGTMFSGVAPSDRRDPAGVAARLSLATSREELRGLLRDVIPPIPGGRRDMAASDNSFRVRLPHPDGTGPPIGLHIRLEAVSPLPAHWPQENGIPAPAFYQRIVPPPHGMTDAFVLRVSAQTDPLNVMPALAHELIEIRMVAEARARGVPIDPSGQVNSLAPGAPDGPLSAHDLGRVEQLRARMAQVDAQERLVQAATSRGAAPAEIEGLAATRDRLREDARLLAAHMGLDDEPGGALRLRRIVEHPLVQEPALAALSRAVDDARAARLAALPDGDMDAEVARLHRDADAAFDAYDHDRTANLPPPGDDPSRGRSLSPDERAAIAGRAADGYFSAPRELTDEIRRLGSLAPAEANALLAAVDRRATHAAELQRLREIAPAAVDHVLGAETPGQERAALRALRDTLRAAGMSRAAAGEAVTNLRQIAGDRRWHEQAALGALRQALLARGMSRFAVGRELGILRVLMGDTNLRGVIDHRVTMAGRSAHPDDWPASQSQLRAWTVMLPGLGGVASLPAPQRAALLARFQELYPPARRTADNFQRYWQAVERSNMLPVVSEIEGTRLLDQRLGMRVLKGGPGRDRFGAGGHGANQPGIDIVGFVPTPEGQHHPARVGVILGDDKAYKSRDPRGVTLEGVSALVENLTRNLGTEAEAQRAAARAQERQGFPRSPDHDQAIRQMEAAAGRLAALDADPRWRDNSGRFTDPDYIRAVRDILDGQHISLVVTSAHGNVTSLSQQLQGYGFRIER